MTGWTQPLCMTCWRIFSYGVAVGAKDEDPRIRVPYRLNDANPELCVNCAQPTRDGIYIRVLPEQLLGKEANDARREELSNTEWTEERWDALDRPDDE